MSQKNLLFLMLSCTIIFVTIKGSIGGGGGRGILGQAQGEGQVFLFSSLWRVTSFSALNLKSPSPAPLIISDKSFNGFKSWNIYFLFPIWFHAFFVCEYSQPSQSGHPCKADTPVKRTPL